MDRCILDGMILARMAAESSNCHRRKIGAAINITHNKTWYMGSNNSPISCIDCTRLTGICPAIHAEQSALLPAVANQVEPLTGVMFVWSEIPCETCLSFIRRTECVGMIYCLSPLSYRDAYPHLNWDSIAYRTEFAKRLGLVIVELDMHKIMEETTHGISGSSST